MKKSWCDIRPDLMSEANGENYLITGEQDLMKYYYGSKDSSRVIVAAEDVKGLL